MTMPDWLAEALPKRCACGAGFTDNENLTARRCLNPMCPYHRGPRVEKLAKVLGVDGVGEKTALTIAQRADVKHHLDAIPLWFRDKPTVALEDFPKLLQIEGCDTVFKQYLQGQSDIETAFADMPESLKQYKYSFLFAAKYVNIKQLGTRSKAIVAVMMTGEVHGWPSRDTFLAFLNEQYGAYVQFRDVGVRKTGVNMLICEPDTPVHNKTRIARERGIPIVTPGELLATLQQQFGGESSDAE